MGYGGQLHAVCALSLVPEGARRCHVKDLTTVFLHAKMFSRVHGLRRLWKVLRCSLHSSRSSFCKMTRKCEVHECETGLWSLPVQKLGCCGRLQEPLGPCGAQGADEGYNREHFGACCLVQGSHCNPCVAVAVGGCSPLIVTEGSFSKNEIQLCWLLGLEDFQ
jgi:hypothetical protein